MRDMEHRPDVIKHALPLLRGYVLMLQDPLHLLDWNVEVLTLLPDDPDISACIRTTVGRKQAAILVADRFFETPPEEQRQTIVHELLHLHTNLALDVFRMIQQARTEGWLALGAIMHENAIEHTTDALADVIAPFLALPAQPVKAERRGQYGYDPAAPYAVQMIPIDPEADSDAQ